MNGTYKIDVTIKTTRFSFGFFWVQVQETSAKLGKEEVKKLEVNSNVDCIAVRAKSFSIFYNKHILSPPQTTTG